MWGHLFFFFVLRDCMHWLAHSRGPNSIILRDKMASSMRWTVFELFLTAALALRRRRRGMMNADPHLVPPASTPARPAVTSPRAAEGCVNPYMKEETDQETCAPKSGARLRHDNRNR